MVLTARPESAILTPSQQDEHQWIGIVRERMLLGDCVRTEVELDNGLRVIAQTTSQGAQFVGNVGERVRVNFVKDGPIAYQIPAHGLDVELALE